jgi:hypothetical protein
LSIYVLYKKLLLTYIWNHFEKLATMQIWSLRYLRVFLNTFKSRNATSRSHDKYSTVCISISKELRKFLSSR